jgi:hypothetical protein
VTSAPGRDPPLRPSPHAAERSAPVQRPPARAAGRGPLDGSRLLVKNAMSTIKAIKTCGVPVVPSTINVATGRGDPYLGAALGEAAIGAARTPSFLGARYRRLARRMPKRKPSSRPGIPCSPSSAPCSPTLRQLPRPRPRLLRTAHAHPPPGPQLHPQPGTPRLQSHHPAHPPRHRRTPSATGWPHPTSPTTRGAAERCRAPS